MSRRLLLSTALAMAAGAACLLLLVLTPQQGDVSAVLLLAVLTSLLGLMLRYLVTAPGEIRFLWWVLLSTILLRFAFTILQHYIDPDLGLKLEQDGRAVTAAGRELALGWERGLTRFAWPADLKHLHDWLTLHRSAWLFYCLGYSPLLPAATNIVASASCALAGYVVVRRWLTIDAARIAALLIAFWPSLMVWSSHNLKDPVNMAALSWSVCGLLLLRERFSVPAIVLVASSWAIGFLIRPYMGVLTIAGEIAAIGVIAIRSKSFLGSASMATITVVTAAFAVWAGIHEAQQMYGEQASLEGAETKRRTYYEGAVADRAQGVGHSEYVVNLKADTPLESLLQLPLRIPLFLFSPIPVRFGSLRLMATYPEMLFLYWLIPGFVAGLAYIWRQGRAEALFVLSSMAPILIVFSVGTSISGEAMRYRNILLPQLLVFAAVGWALKRARRREAQRERALSGHQQVGPAQAA